MTTLEITKAAKLKKKKASSATANSTPSLTVTTSPTKSIPTATDGSVPDAYAHLNEDERKTSNESKATGGKISKELLGCFWGLTEITSELRQESTERLLLTLSKTVHTQVGHGAT